MTSRAGLPQQPYELPALIGRLLLPGESVMESLTWRDQRGAIEAADQGDGRLVAVPRQPGGVGTLARIVHVAQPADGKLAHVELVGERRVRLCAAPTGRTSPRVLVSDLPVPAPLHRGQADRLRALIARVTADGAGDDFDLTGVGPADRIDRLTGHLATTEAVRRGVLRCPTLEGRLRKLERWVNRPKPPARQPRGFDDDGPDPEGAKEDDRLAALPDAVREAVERDQKSEDSRAFGHALIDAALAIQWQAPPQPPIDLRRARQLLDESHGGNGLTEVKEAVGDVLGMLEWRRKRGLPPGSGDMTALALIGPPGVGKTSVAVSIAAATGRQLQTFALGGMDDVFLSGIDASYMHARPGELMRRLISSEHSSLWVGVLDEIDKIDPRPPHSPLATLLAILDPSQNKALQVDHCYEALRVDLSGVLWIATGNDLDAIPAPLRDRMRVLHIPAQTREEQVAIGRDYLLPRLLKDNDIDDQVLQLPEETVEALVTGYPPSEGMRPLEQRLTAVVRRALRHHLVTHRPIRVTPELARSWLPSGEPERRIGFQVQPAGVTPRAGQARVVGRAPAVSPRRRLRRSSPRAPETSPHVSTGGGQP